MLSILKDKTIKPLAVETQQGARIILNYLRTAPNGFTLTPVISSLESYQ